MLFRCLKRPGNPGHLRHRTVLVLALGRDRCFGSNEKAKQRKHHALERKTQQERDQTLEPITMCDHCVPRWRIFG